MRKVMRKDQKNIIKEKEKKAGKILARIERQGVSFVREEGLNSLKIRVYGKAWLFSALAFINVGIIGYTHVFNEKPKIVSLYSTSYTAEIERLEFLRTKEQVSNMLIEFKIPHHDEVSTFTIDKGKIKGL
jgi:hypothetical protein